MGSGSLDECNPYLSIDHNSFLNGYVECGKNKIASCQHYLVFLNPYTVGRYSTSCTRFVLLFALINREERSVNNRVIDLIRGL